MSQIQITGRITKGIGGFYYIATDGGGVIECAARGIFRKNKITPMVGDLVRITMRDDAEVRGSIEEILPRKNSLIRPPVANIDVVVIVIAASSPAPNFMTIDKLTASAQNCNIDVCVCINKSDLADTDGIVKIYRTTGYPVVVTDALKGVGIDELLANISGKVSAFAGNSGVGKSTLLNKICGDELLEVGAVSQKIARGRHTTRHVELIELSTGGYVMDTPGFSSLELDDVTPEFMRELFPEFLRAGSCKFADCAHTGGDCAVIRGVQSGEVATSRYDNYVAFYNEAKRNRGIRF